MTLFDIITKNKNLKDIQSSLAEVKNDIKNLPCIDINKLLMLHNIKVELIKDSKNFNGLIFLSSYETKTRTINLYLQEIDSLKKKLTDKNTDLEKIAIAHELYHAIFDKKEPSEVKESKAVIFSLLLNDLDPLKEISF
jgi:phage tail sheath protein FI